MLGHFFGFKASQLRVHDAFLVKYSAGAQAMLPMHSDESLYSLTIPLNDIKEYAGGGTYFADLRQSLRLPHGHVIAFEGGLFHAGEPIVVGTRYIIAAFLYTEAAATDLIPSCSSTGDTADVVECKRQRTAVSRLFDKSQCEGSYLQHACSPTHGGAGGASGFTFGFQSPVSSEHIRDR